MSLLKFFPEWVYWIVIGALVVLLGAQQVRVANAHTELANSQTELAQEQKARSAETAQRVQVALKHAGEIKQLQEKHAEEQQAKEDLYVAKIKKLEADNRAGLATADRLRNTLATIASGDRRPGETDAAALQRTANRLQLVSRLLAEGVDLVTEGRAVVEGRDLEVGRLLEQISIDRAACSAGDKGSPQP